jgi:BolA protein
MDRITLIRERLQIFNPTHLEVIDDNAKHRGHVGSRDGAGHYTVIIAAESFAGKRRVAVHKEVYAALADLIPKEIHALVIKILAPPSS